ncbi:5-hydroxyisourate hydrolase [Rhodobium orientis]|uniref:5-hydroxyisourate hydrolase n=1 Tax=Rhodobium orientis TaxID=34017 RepID=A0A327JN22_9HYPH|nr:hydroxyisourate hydrolase [Rhodobium orientis]MBB4304961.1 5-hydroxyisourate hydrolase [Rhodobium orientis]MBK5951280.1 hydroxyisourate hydrolase [Rhodobium orientis]RAI27115.1 hydroxyisourate hydrolase [Rhodobium orientis]
MADGYLTTHILDTANGCPAAGVDIVLYRLDGETRTELARATTNGDGRTDAPLIARGALQCGSYELEFAIGAYFAGKGIALTQPFLEVVPIRFGIDDAAAHYHVPLLASPFGYSTYRGS